MKTITEFNAIELKNHLKTLELLSKAGKTAEEISLAFGEATKKEGDKLKFFVNALESIKARAQGLKRVVVLAAPEEAPEEGPEKAPGKVKDKIPQHAEKRDGYIYLPEYYPALPGEKKGRPGRGAGKDGGRGGGRRGGQGPGRFGKDKGRSDRSGGFGVVTKGARPQGVQKIAGIEVHYVGGPPASLNGDERNKKPDWKKRPRFPRNPNRGPRSSGGLAQQSGPSAAQPPSGGAPSLGGTKDEKLISLRTEAEKQLREIQGVKSE